MAQPHPADDTNELKPNWDLPDVVKSQGAYLVTRPPTPIHQKQNVEKFASTLCADLERALRGHEIRRKKYGNAADEWPSGHTPPELVEKHDAELKALVALMEGPSPPSDFDDSKKGDPEEEKEKGQRESGSHYPNHPRLPTPSPSDVESIPNSVPYRHQSPFPTLESKTKHGKKRRLDGTENGHYKKHRKDAAEAPRQCLLPGPDKSMLKAAPTRGMKRRRFDAEEKEEENQLQNKQKTRAGPISYPPRCSLYRDACGDAV